MSLKRYLMISWKPDGSGAWEHPKFDIVTDTGDTDIKQTADFLSQSGGPQKHRPSYRWDELGRRVEVYPLPELPLYEYVLGEAVHHE